MQLHVQNGVALYLVKRELLPLPIDVDVLLW